MNKTNKEKEYRRMKALTIFCLAFLLTMFLLEMIS